MSAARPIVKTCATCAHFKPRDMVTEWGTCNLGETRNEVPRFKTTAYAVDCHGWQAFLVVKTSHGCTQWKWTSKQ